MELGPFLVASPKARTSSLSHPHTHTPTAGKDAALISATAGKLNGLASMGAVAQSLLAPQLVKYLGWPGLFAVLGLAMLAAALVLRPAVAIEAAALRKKKV